ncbi:penicillin-binding protein 1A [Catenovulum agarivorans DS-2]|uniref:Penicillin-binding protein 1A n=1 Tax=Catenovulum agarivorans DS-2 TaxID=1328313 RepID=W7QKP1_9ALTE|nr:hypothetical protein [Catenovulum agarivorans]EWH08633.1 penicillin-binding protein 1A [Catenovulum agarivorans DS-2]
MSFIHKIICSLFLSAIATSQLMACDIQVTHPLQENSKDELVVELLKLSLSKVNKSVCFDELSETLTEARKVHYVIEKRLSLKWGSAGGHYVEHLQEVAQPIFRGLGGYRILVIRQGEEARFKNVNSLEDLTSFTVGQGAFWGDTRVLENAGLKVEKSTQARKLWKMLHAKRFDYIALAVHEPWKELAVRPDLQMAVEPNILLVYPSALYFYVHKNNQALYELLDSGMKKALADGSYYQKLVNSQMIKDTIKYANIAKRKVIELDNPFIKQNDMATTELLKYLVSANDSAKVTR